MNIIFLILKHKHHIQEIPETITHCSLTILLIADIGYHPLFDCFEYCVSRKCNSRERLSNSFVIVFIWLGLNIGLSEHCQTFKDFLMDKRNIDNFYFEINRNRWLYTHCILTSTSFLEITLIATKSKIPFSSDSL